MNIYTSYAAGHSEHFLRLKRRTSGDWRFLISGEWSQSPYHQGNHRFYIRSSKDKQYWALLSIGFPNRIIAVAHTPVPTTLEAVAANMMRMVRQHHGDYIDLVHENGDIDGSLLWKLYRAQSNAA